MQKHAERKQSRDEQQLSLSCILNPLLLESASHLSASLLSHLFDSPSPPFFLCLPFSNLWTAVFQGYHRSGKKENCANNLFHSWCPHPHPLFSCFRKTGIALEEPQMRLETDAYWTGL